MRAPRTCRGRGPVDRRVAAAGSPVWYIRVGQRARGPPPYMMCGRARTVINEIYPFSAGVCRVATAANWGAAWLVTQFFLSLTGWLGEAFTFRLFGRCAWPHSSAVGDQGEDTGCGARTGQNGPAGSAELAR